MIAESRYQPLASGAATYGYPGYDEEYFTWAGTLRAGNAAGDFCTSTTTITHAVDGINSSDYNPAGSLEFDVVTRTFGSFHPAGCQVAMADGSVHFLSEAMDINIFRDLAARNDGMPVGGFQP